jgi:hypothetical protein
VYVSQSTACEVEVRCYFIDVYLLFKIKTVGHVIKYYYTPFSLMHCFGYSLVTSTVCEELDLGAHIGCIRLPFLNQV